MAGQTKTLDFSDLGAQPVAQPGQGGGQLDFSDLGAKRVITDASVSADTGSPNSNQPSLWDRVSASYDPGAAEFDARHPVIGKPIRYFSALGGAVLGAPGGIYHAFADEPSQEETDRAGGPEEVEGSKRIGLGLERLIADPLVNAVRDYASGKVTWGGAKAVLPEALGQGTGAAISPEVRARGWKLDSAWYSRCRSSRNSGRRCG